MIAKSVYYAAFGSRVLTPTCFVAQYNAWCLKNGDHKTPKKKVNWNRELIWKMRTELEYQWDLLEEIIPDTFKELLDSVISHLRSLKLLLKSKFIDSIAKDHIWGL